MKKSIFLFFAAILCAMTANAYNQSAKDLYFDNSEAKWEKCYVYIGHSSWTSCYDMTRVAGTQYLWKLPSNFNGGSSWNSATGWVVCKEKWWASNGESIDKYTWHGDKNVTQKATSAWVDSNIYKTNGTASTKSDNHTINAYKITSYAKADYAVTINTVEGGTLTVKDYDNNVVTSGASKIHLTVLKFSAAPADGYVLDAVEINDGSTTTTIAAADLASKTYTLTSAVTITPVWHATTSTVTVTATATNGTVAGDGVVEKGATVTLTATPADGYKFINWTVGGVEVSTDNPYTFIPTEDVTVVANFEQLPPETVYFVNAADWTGTINIHAWGGTASGTAWPGNPAHKEDYQIGGHDVYSLTAAAGAYANVIFNNKVGDAGNQTADLEWTAGKYYVVDEWLIKEEAEEKLASGEPLGLTYNVTVPAGTNACYIAGEMNGWSQQEMTKVDDTHYTITIVGATTAMKYKYCSGPAWDYEELNADGSPVADRTHSENDVVAKWKKVYNPNPTVDPEPDPTFDYYVTGSFNEWANPDPNHGMTLDGDVYKATLTLAAGETQLKVTNGTWDNAKGFDAMGAEYEEVTREAKDGNILVTLATGKDVVVVYDATAGKVTFEGLTEKAPSPKFDYYVVGSFNDWKNPDANHGMTLVGDVYKATVTLNVGANMLKVTNGTWENAKGFDAMGAEYEEVSNDTKDGNILITLTEGKDVVVVYNATTGKVTFEGLTEKVVVTPDVITYVLMGVGGDWTTGIALTKNETAEYGEEYVLLGQEIAEGDAVKVVTLVNGVAEAYCGAVENASPVKFEFDNDGNIVLLPGKYDFYFKVNDPTTYEDDAMYIAGEAYPVEPEYNVVEDEITNLMIDMESMCIIGGPSAEFGVDVFLALTEQNQDGTWALSDESSVAIQGVDATFIDGYAYDIDVYAPAVKVVLHVEFGGTKYELQIDMTSKPVVIEIADAIVSKEEYPDGMGGTYTNWTMDGQWSDGETTYPVLVDMPDFDPTIVEADMMVTIRIGSWLEVMYGAAEGLVHATVAENVVTLTGTLTSYAAGTWEVTISGTLPGGATTALDNIDATVAPVKAIVNGQLVITKDGVQYNAQGQVVK